jgi:hypothetical protein
MFDPLHLLLKKCDNCFWDRKSQVENFVDSGIKSIEGLSCSSIGNHQNVSEFFDNEFESIL